MARGFFVSLEGGEGAGKSTQAEALARRLGKAQIPTTLVREPGTTVLGTYLRDYLKSTRPISRESELLLFEAARAQLVSEIIRPSLERGMVVVSDRFEASSVAYQGYGRRIAVDAVHRLNEFAVQGTLPDLTLLLDISPEEGLRRTGNPQLALNLDSSGESGPTRQDTAGTRRFEEQPLGFHTRVREGFLRQARDNPERWVVVDASRSRNDVHDEIWRNVADRLPWPSGKAEPPGGGAGEQILENPVESNQPLL